jgi:hypothetical protein
MMETLLLSTTIRTNLPTQILEMGKRKGKEFLRWAFDILILSAVMIAVLLWRDEKEEHEALGEAVWGMVRTEILICEDEEGRERVRRWFLVRLWELEDLCGW